MDNFYVNEAAHWFSDYTTINFKVEPKVRYDLGSGYIAVCTDNSTNELRFNDDYNGARESDVIYHEYTHAVHWHMFDGFNFTQTVSQAGAIGEGIADYFPCSINNEYTFHNGEDAEDIFYVSNLKAFPADYDSSGDNSINGLIVAGACWNLRGITEEGTSADEIILGALEISPQADEFEEFFDYALLADDDINGNGYWNWPGCGYGWGDKSPNAEEIWTSFAAVHGLPSSLLSEDPDCSAKLVANSFMVTDRAEEKDLLKSPYPNPFNAETVIKFQADGHSAVDVKVYGVNGQVVRSLVVGRVVEQGWHNIVWNGRSDEGKALGSGVYFVKVKTGERLAVKKVVMVQ